MLQTQEELIVTKQKQVARMDIAEQRMKDLRTNIFNYESVCCAMRTFPVDSVRVLLLVGATIRAYVNRIKRYMRNSTG
jgi:hypothetical protein